MSLYFEQNQLTYLGEIKKFPFLGGGKVGEDSRWTYALQVKDLTF